MGSLAIVLAHLGRVGGISRATGKSRVLVRREGRRLSINWLGMMPGFEKTAMSLASRFLLPADLVIGRIMT